MRLYLVKRVLFFIPVLFFIILLSFVLLHYSPGDPVERILTTESADAITRSEVSEQTIQLLRKQFGLDLPLFYVSISTLGEKQNVSDSWKHYIPAISFHGNNQFHRWFFGDGNSGGLIHGDLGRSWITTEPIMNMIGPKLFWSLLLTLFSVLLAYLISIPLGIKAALQPHSGMINYSNKLFIVLFSLPAFWIATLLMFLFCNPQMINILPSSGVGPVGGYSSDTGVLSRIIHSLPYLILPTICYTYSSLAFLSNNVKVSLVQVLGEDYIRTARAKGLSEKTVIYKHAMRNALLPMITIFAGIFPFAIGGSVILETVFTLPGMGLLIYNSISSQDYPVVTSVFLLTGVVTVITFFITDIIYAIADPRISFAERK